MVLIKLVAMMLSATSPNMIQNGDFSLGNKLFTSEYTYQTDLGPEGCFCIGNDPQSNNGGGASFGGPKSLKENFLIVNGSPVAHTMVWKQQVKLKAGSHYTFTYWAASWGKGGDDARDPSPAALVASANKLSLGPIFNLPAKDGIWTKEVIKFKSSHTGNFSLGIEDRNLEGYGNDFAIANISLRMS